MPDPTRALQNPTEALFSPVSKVRGKTARLPTAPQSLDRQATFPRAGEISEQLLHINVRRFRGGLVFKAHRLCVSLSSRIESNNEEEKGGWADGCWGLRVPGLGGRISGFGFWVDGCGV